MPGVGQPAAQRALRRLGARKVKTTRAPVVFDPFRAAGLIGSLAGAASGPSLYKGASFLQGKLGQHIASPNVTIVDDGTMPGGLGSKPFDGEGLPTNRKNLVEAGVLKTYAGKQSWLWTANFEAFDAFPRTVIPGGQTPAGTYR